MSLAETDQPQTPPRSFEELTRVPEKDQRRMRRGRQGMVKDAPKRRLCVRFERGDTYWYITGKNQLNFQATVTNADGSGKPNHRIRGRHNFIRPIVTAKVSASSQRVPDFEVVPTTLDPQRVGAAQLAEKASRYGYDKWGMHDVDVRCSYSAIGGGGDAFAFPFFNPNVGPYHQVEDPETGQVEWVGEGEIEIVVLNGNQAYWEDGAEFKKSRWHAIERAMDVDDVYEMPGYLGGKLVADAATSDIPTDTRPENMVMVTEYFERPCPKYPEGRHLVIANGRQVIPERQYPLRNKNGEVIDEPVLHRLAWDLDSGAQRDFGLTWQLIDLQRTVQDVRNKQVEWKNRCLVPQWWIRGNSVVDTLTDEPGARFRYEGEQPPTQIQVPPIPDSLEALIRSVKADMQEIGFDNQIEASPDVAARTVQAVVEQSAQQWATFLIGKAEWWSRLMRHCLLLVANHYSEERLLKFRGRDGWEHIQDFEGAALMDEIDVRVSPASLVTLTRAQVRDMLQWIATTFPGWLNPQDALAALQTGSLDRLLASYWLDVARANTVIQKIRDGTVMDMPDRGSRDPITKQPIQDPATGEQMPYPGYMPDEQDNLHIWERVFSDWMKTDDYSEQPPEAQEITRQIWDAIQGLKDAQAMHEAMLQTQTAEQMGMTNATKPAQPKPLPSQPAPAQ